MLRTFLTQKFGRSDAKNIADSGAILADPVGSILHAAVSVVVMPLLARAKRRVVQWGHVRLKVLHLD